MAGVGDSYTVQAASRRFLRTKFHTCRWLFRVYEVIMGSLLIPLTTWTKHARLIEGKYRPINGWIMAG
jgi:hypothetical protein